MNGLWATLLPLILGGAVVPIQLIITILLLRSGGGPKVAASFVGGMTATRLTQGLVFGLVLSGGATTGSSGSGPGPVISGVLVALALMLYATAVKQLLTHDDPDAPPPKWITMTETMTAGRAFLIGAGVLAIGAKFWVFTLGAIGAIRDTQPGVTKGTIEFVAFALLTVLLHLVVIGLAALLPSQSADLLDASASWLKDHNRVIVIALSAVFGTWFLVKGLHGFGAA